jgi:hypothetical protein
MKLVRDFERRLEQLVDGMAGKVFRGRLHPVEVAARLVREADLTLEESPAGPVAANVYVLRLNPRDLDTEVPTVVVQELEKVLETTAADRGWRLDGPVRVTIEHDENVSAGTVGCRVERVRGRRDPWAYLIDGDSHHPVEHNRCVIGRSEEADVIIANPGVSRVHALLWREGGDIWIMDLHSANGTSVNGTEANGPAHMETGSVVTFGPATLTFRLA